MQAIETKYYGPTDSKAARIRVKAQRGARFFSWDHELDVDANHTAAARQYAASLDWRGSWVGGGNAAGDGNVYVCIGRAFDCTFEIDPG